MKFIVWLILILGLNVIQVALRDYFNFYPNSIFVSILIGGYVGFISTCIALSIK